MMFKLAKYQLVGSQQCSNHFIICFSSCWQVNKIVLVNYLTKVNDWAHTLHQKWIVHLTYHPVLPCILYCTAFFRRSKVSPVLEMNWSFQCGKTFFINPPTLLILFSPQLLVFLLNYITMVFIFRKIQCISGRKVSKKGNKT